MTARDSHNPTQHVGNDGRASPWRDALRERLRASPTPVFDFGDHTIPAASIWNGSRQWVEAFRRAGLAPGHRVALCLEPSAAFLAVLVAALCEGLTLCPLDSRLDPATAAALIDAAAVISHLPGPHTWTPESPASPPDSTPPLRTPILAPTPDIRFLVRTSGSSGAARTVALTDRNVLSVLESHRPHLGLDPESVVASVLPWHHAFGLILDLLPALFAGATVIRHATSIRDPAALLHLLRDREVNHLSGVPLTFARLFDRTEGPSVLARLRGGIVGGAPVSASLAARLAATQLRAGYGQTEAAPGIALGEPGQWSAGWLGAAVGCEARVTERGTLAFRGENAFANYFDASVGGLDETQPSGAARGWVDTGDLVEAAPDGSGWTFIGRADDSFKLSNGRLVSAAHAEAALRDALHDIDEAAIFTADGERLTVILTPRSGAEHPTRAQVAVALGPLAPLLREVIIITAETRNALPRTSKGAIDRSRLRTFADHPPAARAA